MSIATVLFISSDFSSTEFLQTITRFEAQNEQVFNASNNNFMVLFYGLYFAFNIDVLAFVFIFLSFVILNVCIFFYEDIFSSSINLSCCFLLKITSVCAFTATNIFTFIVFMEMSAI